MDRGLQAFACLLLILLFGTVLLGILTRAMGDPLIWTDEGARFLMVWLACTGWVLAGRRRGHVRIRFFQQLLPPRLRRGVWRLVQLALLGFGAVIAFYAIGLVRRNASLEATALPVSAAWLYVPLIPAGVALVLQAASELRDAPE